MTDAPPITRFALMRHALTEWNESKRIQGRTDTRLSREGVRQASAWSRQLARGSPSEGFDRILASDLIRARKTAASINHRLDLPIHIDGRLREQDWGEWVGITIGNLYKQFPDILAEQEASGWDFRPPGGESRREVLTRGREAVFEAAQKWPGQTILIVTHKGVMKCLLYDLLERMCQPTESYMIHDYHLHWVSVRNRVLKLDGLNAMSLNRW